MIPARARSHTPDDIIWEDGNSDADLLGEEEGRSNDNGTVIKKRKLTEERRDVDKIVPTKTTKRSGPFIDESDSEEDDDLEALNDEPDMISEESRKDLCLSQDETGTAPSPVREAVVIDSKDDESVYFDESLQREEEYEEEEQQDEEILEKLPEINEEECGMQLQDKLCCTEESVCPICQTPLVGFTEMV